MSLGSPREYLYIRFSAPLEKTSLSLSSCRYKPVVDVMDRVLEIHGLQMISHGDPLAELPHFFPLQNLNELGLSRQDDLYKLFPVCLQVRDQPDLFEHRCFQILCLIDGKDNGAALGILLEKKLVEGIQEA